MTSFKSGSGNLDFGGGSDDENDESDDPKPATRDVSSKSDNEETSQPEPSADRSSIEEASSREEAQSQSHEETTKQEYPYFVRRNNVGDERDHRIEVHLRETVSGQESEFRSELADHLDTSEVPKTDAREFALKYAFQNPEKVAELMRDEGFGLLN